VESETVGNKGFSAIEQLEQLIRVSQKRPRLLKKALSDQLVVQNRIKTSPNADKTGFSVPEIGVTKGY
jgi:hypothetical protein